MNRFERALRAMFPGSDPSRADLERVERKYRKQISTNRYQRRQNLVLRAAAAVFVTLLGVAVVMLRPSPVEATLTEIAQAARSVEPSELADGDYFFTESTSTFERTVSIEDGRQITYTIDEDRQVWVSRNGTDVVIRSTRVNPNFVTKADRNLYFSLGLDRADNLGTPQTSAVDGVSHVATERDWPRQGDALIDAIHQLQGVTTDTHAAAQLLTLITESPAPPDLRAATIEAIARLELELVETSSGAITVRTKPTELDNRIVEFTLDSDGQLRQRTDFTHDPTTTPPDAMIFVAMYSPTRIVDGPP